MYARLQVVYFMCLSKNSMALWCNAKAQSECCITPDPTSEPSSKPLKGQHLLDRSRHVKHPSQHPERVWIASNLSIVKSFPPIIDIGSRSERLKDVPIEEDSVTETYYFSFWWSNIFFKILEEGKKYDKEPILEAGQPITRCGTPMVRRLKRGRGAGWRRVYHTCLDF